MNLLARRPPRYQAFLLRCWEEPPAREGDPPGHRFSLEDPQTGERHNFTSLGALMAFVQAAIGEGHETPTPS